MKKERKASCTDVTQEQAQPIETCILCEGETQEMTEIIKDYVGIVTNHRLARMLYAFHVQRATLQGEEDIRAWKSIVNHLEGEHRFTPEQMAKHRMRDVKLYRKMCRNSQGKLFAKLYLFYCKERDIALPLAVRYIPKFNLDKFKQKDGELLHCAVSWISENQAKLQELNAAIFSGPDGTFDATAMRLYRGLHQLIIQMYKVLPLKNPTVATGVETQKVNFCM